MSFANNKGADQPAHLHRLIGAFVVRCQDSTCMTAVLALAEIQDSS